jgi:hypothetical protein
MLVRVREPTYLEEHVAKVVFDRCSVRRVSGLFEVVA